MKDYKSIPSGTLIVWEIGVEDGFTAFNLHINHDEFSCATVWENAVWHTWDKNGTGGENSSEASVQAAMHEALFSAINQGFTKIAP